MANKIPSDSQWEDLASRIKAIANSVPSANDIINLIYPVGSYYSTSNSSFNPNTSWTGTWVLCAPSVNQPLYTWIRTA